MELSGLIHMNVAYGPSAAVMAILAMLDFHLTSLSYCLLIFSGRPAIGAFLYECIALIQEMASFMVH